MVRSQWWRAGRRELGKQNGFKSPDWFLVPSDKTPSVRTCGLKPSTLKQLGQPIQQPPNTGEVKVRPSQPQKERCVEMYSVCLMLESQGTDKRQMAVSTGL